MTSMDEDVRRGSSRKLPSLGDAALALGVAVLTALRSDDIGYLNDRFESVGQWVVAALVFVVVLFRRRAPHLAVIAAAGADIFADLTGLTPLGTHVAWAVCVFSAFRYLSTRVAVAVVVPALILELVAFASTEGWRLLTTTSAALLAATGLSVGISLALRSRDRLVADSAERVQLVEATRDAEIARQLAEERLRTARDLHDTLAHQIAVINLNAGVGLRALPSDIAEASRSLTTIQTASRETIAQIRDLLSDLRSGRPTAARQNLGDVPQLIERLRLSGMRIEFAETGSGPATESMTSALGYRLILEALTNALKHGDPRGTTTVLIEHGEDVRIVVLNDVRKSNGGFDVGHGLTGMSEAVAAAQGEFRSGLEGSQYRIEAVLPTTIGVAK